MRPKPLAAAVAFGPPAGGRVTGAGRGQRAIGPEMKPEIVSRTRKKGGDGLPVLQLTCELQ